MGHVARDSAATRINVENVSKTDQQREGDAAYLASKGASSNTPAPQPPRCKRNTSATPSLSCSSPRPPNHASSPGSPNSEPTSQAFAGQNRHLKKSLMEPAVCSLSLRHCFRKDFTVEPMHGNLDTVSDVAITWRQDPLHYNRTSGQTCPRIACSARLPAQVH